MKWLWNIEPRGFLKLLAPIVRRMGERLELATWTDLKKVMEAQSEAAASLLKCSFALHDGLAKESRPLVCSWLPSDSPQPPLNARRVARSLLGRQCLRTSLCRFSLTLKQLRPPPAFSVFSEIPPG
jgi:hypothetical protein